MSEIYTTGAWRPKPGREQDFVAAWTTFAGWTSTLPGAGTVRLARDAGDPERFVSLSRWQNEDVVRAWRSSPEYRERIGRVLQHVDGFEPAELTVMVTAVPETAAVGQTGGQA
ncbi:MAG TPA: antibiotic biosynthesis monooxygenase family protein [Steroidobacteraceae bacterium]|nr:antibiotic biosynthesis monooxygenase family protein [Steroidobacteraceae bacterium]